MSETASLIGPGMSYNYQFGRQLARRIDAFSTTLFSSAEFEDTGESAIGFESVPDWVGVVEERLNRLQELTYNWDRQGALPNRYDVVVFATTFMQQILFDNTAAPQILPLASGGLQLEWHTKGIDLEIEIAAPNEVYIIFEDELAPETNFDTELNSDYSSLIGPIKALSER